MVVLVASTIPSVTTAMLVRWTNVSMVCANIALIRKALANYVVVPKIAVYINIVQCYHKRFNCCLCVCHRAVITKSFALAHRCYVQR